MTDKTADAGPPPSVDIQDPLPEASWIWRRLLTWAVLLLCSVALWQILEALHDLKSTQGLIEIAKWLIVTLNLTLFYYMAGANAAELVRLVQSVKLFGSGARMEQHAFAEDDRGNRAGSTTTIETPANSGAAGRLEPSGAPEAQTTGAAQPPLSGAPARPEKTPWE